MQDFEGVFNRSKTKPENEYPSLSNMEFGLGAVEGKSKLHGGGEG